MSGGWAIAYLSDNIEMMGFLGRFMLFIERALDNGKIDLAWLMTGFAEPKSSSELSFEKDARSEAFLATCEPTVGFSESRLSSRFGFPRVSNGISGEAKRKI